VFQKVDVFLSSGGSDERHLVRWVGSKRLFSKSRHQVIPRVMYEYYPLNPEALSYSFQKPYQQTDFRNVDAPCFIE
jgi:hypothetical protein